MINLQAEKLLEFSETPILAGVHCYFFLLDKEDIAKDGHLHFKDEVVRLDKTDEEIINILTNVLAKHADRGIIDLYIFFYEDKVGVLPLLTPIAERTIEYITEIMVNFRKFGVQNEPEVKDAPKKRKPSRRNTPKVEAV